MKHTIRTWYDAMSTAKHQIDGYSYTPEDFRRDMDVPHVGHTHLVATKDSDGFMSREHLIKLEDSISSSQLSESLIEERRVSDSTYLTEVDLSNFSLYDSSGLVSLRPKIWVGSAVSSGGRWSIDYSTASFTTVFNVIPVGKSGDSSLNSGCVGILESFNNTSATGHLKNVVSAGLLAAMEMVNSENKTVYITVIGI